MKGSVPNTEGMTYGAGSLRSELAPRFKSMKGIQKQRGGVVPEKYMPKIKDEMNERLMGLVDDLLPYDKHYSKYEMGYSDTVAARLGPKERLSDYYDDIPPELYEKINKYKRDLANAPTAYFEAKPQRGVGLGEFSGAVVPENISQESLNILKKHGINRVEKYGGSPYKTKGEAMKKYRDLMFSLGGGGLLINELQGRSR